MNKFFKNSVLLLVFIAAAGTSAYGSDDKASPITIKKEADAELGRLALGLRVKYCRPVLERGGATAQDGCCTIFNNSELISCFFRKGKT